MGNLDYDEKEFEELFTESPDARNLRRPVSLSSKTPKKKSVQVIDGKRSKNGGIILIRLKMKYEDISRVVDTM